MDGVGWLGQKHEKHESRARNISVATETWHTFLLAPDQPSGIIFPVCAMLAMARKKRMKRGYTVKRKGEKRYISVNHVARSYLISLLLNRKITEKKKFNINVNFFKVANFFIIAKDGIN